MSRAYDALVLDGVGDRDVVVHDLRSDVPGAVATGMTRCAPLVRRHDR